MKRFLILITLFIWVNLAYTQDEVYSYRWIQYGIEFITEDKLDIVEADLEQFRCDGEESNLWITKMDAYLSPDEREKYIEHAISEHGYKKIGRTKTELKDSVYICSSVASNDNSYGYIFLFSDSLANNNLFIGYLTPGKKPKSNIRKNLEINLFSGDNSYTGTIKQSTDGNLTIGIDLDNSFIKEYSNSDTLILGKKDIKETITKIAGQYSPKISLMLNTYYNLPRNLGARNLGDYIDFTDYTGDTIDLKTLYLNSTFAHEMLHNLDGRLSVQQSIKKTRGNYTDKIYSYYIDSSYIDVDRLTVPPANIIHKSFPSQFRSGNLYSLYIYPSSLNIHTQVYGIYSLIEELNAYNQNLIWYNDLLQFYYDNQMANASFFAKYIVYSTDKIQNVVSVKQYILHYLLVLKSSSPDLYSKLMDDEKLKKTLNNLFEILNNGIVKFNHNKTKISDDLAQEYVRFIETDEKLIINDIGYKNDEVVKTNNMISFINNETDYLKINSDLHGNPIVPIVMIK